MTQDRPDTVTVYPSRSLFQTVQRWRWRRTAPNGEVLSQSSEGYRDRSWCVEMALRCNADITEAELQAK